MITLLAIVIHIILLLTLTYSNIISDESIWIWFIFTTPFYLIILPSLYISSTLLKHKKKKQKHQIKMIIMKNEIKNKFKKNEQIKF